LVAPIACAAGLASGRRPPVFAALLGHDGPRGTLDVALGGSLIVLTLLSIETSFGLVFDPRYRDIPFAPQSAAAFAFLALTLSTPRRAGLRAAAETLAAGVLALAAVYIALNESFANWQALSLCAGFLGLAITLLRARDAPD
jgi:glucan 1,3-beta-glucosidase